MPKTAFTCHLGLFEFKRMPFRLTNAPAVFQKKYDEGIAWVDWKDLYGVYWWYHAVGAVLAQKDVYGQEKVVFYLSCKLTNAQQKWSTIEKEAFAVIYALKKFDAYLHGASIIIKTDHKPLRSLFKSEIKNTKLQRWAIQISEYNP